MKIDVMVSLGWMNGWTDGWNGYFQAYKYSLRRFCTAKADFNRAFFFLLVC